MTKTAHQHELALDDLDAVVGGSASPMAYFHPVAIQATGTIPGVDFSSTSATPFVVNNYGLASHLDLALPAMAHDGGHAVDGIAPSVPGEISAPGALAAPPLHLDPGGTGGLAGQDAQPHGGCHGAAGTDDHGTQAAALPLSLVPIPGELSASTPSATAAAPAPADASVALYLGLPGGTDPHSDTSQPATNDWAPGSFSDSVPASSATSW